MFNSICLHRYWTIVPRDVAGVWNLPIMLAYFHIGLLMLICIIIWGTVR